MFGFMTKARFRLYKKVYLDLLRVKGQYIRDLEAAKKDLEQKLKAVEATLMIVQKSLEESGRAIHHPDKTD